MALQASTEGAAIRLAPYISELHEFFVSRSLKFGSPEDLGPIALQLSVPGSFHDEMASMLRSIIYRQQGNVPHAELLELVTVAIGGPRVDEAAQGVVEPVRRLLAFVSSVFRSRRSASFQGLEANSVAAATPVVEPSAAFSSHQEASESAAATESVDSAPERRDVPVDPNRVSVRTPDSGTPSRASTNVYFRASSILLHPEEAVLVEETLPSAQLAHPVDPEDLQNAIPARPKPQPVRSALTWALGLSVIPLILFINMYLNHRSALSSSQLGGQTSSIATDHLPAPSGVGAVPPAVASLRVSPAKGASSLAPGTVAAPSGAPARQPYPSSASRTDGLPVEPQQGSTQVPTQQSARASTAVPQSQTDPGSSSPGGSLHSDYVPSTSSKPLSSSVSPGHPVRIHQHTRQGSFAVSSGVMTGNLVSAPAPEYPRLASFARIQGQVILQAVVSRNGRVVDTRVIRGPHMLRGAATQAVRRWRYRPYVVDGNATEVATIVSVDFRLNH